MERLFIRWVKFPDDAPIRSFWENWLKKFPQMRTTVAEASELVRISSEWKPDESLSLDEVNSIWGRIRSSIDQVKEMDPWQSRLDTLGVRVVYYKWYIAVLAALLILVLFLLFR